MKKLCVVLMLMAALLFCCNTEGLPRIGSHVAGPNIYLSRYYILHSKEDTGSDNMVTAVLADYRGFDTMCETTVLFLAGLSTVLLLYKGKRKNAATPLDKRKTDGEEEEDGG